MNWSLQILLLPRVPRLLKHNCNYRQKRMVLFYETANGCSPSVAEHSFAALLNRWKKKTDAAF